jgi:hypothetical protein
LRYDIVLDTSSSKKKKEEEIIVIVIDIGIAQKSLKIMGLNIGDGISQDIVIGVADDFSIIDSQPWYPHRKYASSYAWNNRHQRITRSAQFT